MPRTLTEDQSVDLAQLLIMMNVPKEERLDILTAIETPAEMRLFLDKLAVKNFQMSPQEVYQAMLDTVLEIQWAEHKTRPNWDEDLRKGLRESKNDPSGKVYDWKLHETWEDYPVPDYNAVHTYCQVDIEGSGVFYYRTRNPELKVGDKVRVPFGYNCQTHVGTIISMRQFVGKRAPYPLERTKFIMEKAE